MLPRHLFLWPPELHSMALYLSPAPAAYGEKTGKSLCGRGLGSVQACAAFLLVSLTSGAVCLRPSALGPWLVNQDGGALVGTERASGDQKASPNFSVDT